MNEHGHPVPATDTALRDRFINGMSHAASTVNVITTDGPAGRGGVTVSAMSSVSADTPKPTLLICVHHMSPVADQIIENRCFVANVLRDDQAYISDTFAGRFKDHVTDKFDCAEWVAMPTGAPRVTDPLVGFDCRVISSERVGTHHVFFGEVEDIYISGRGSPLLYANRAYGAASRIDPASSIDAGRRGTERTLSIGCLNSFGPFLLPEIIQKLTDADRGLTIAPVEGDQRRIQEGILSGECEIGLMYRHSLPDTLAFEVLSNLDLYVLLAENDALAEKCRIGPGDLVDRSLILLKGPPTDVYLADAARACGRDPYVAYRSNSMEMTRALVGHGLGYAVMATRPATMVTYDGKSLVARPYDGTDATLDIVMAWRGDASLSNSARTFIRFCQDFFGVAA